MRVTRASAAPGGTPALPGTNGARPIWIPAFAGMTGEKAAMTGGEVKNEGGTSRGSTNPLAANN